MPVSTRRTSVNVDSLLTGNHEESRQNELPSNEEQRRNLVERMASRRSERITNENAMRNAARHQRLELEQTAMPGPYFTDVNNLRTETPEDTQFAPGIVQCESDSFDIDNPSNYQECHPPAKLRLLCDEADDKISEAVVSTDWDSCCLFSFSFLKLLHSFQREDLQINSFKMNTHINLLENDKGSRLYVNATAGSGFHPKNSSGNKHNGSIKICRFKNIDLLKISTFKGMFQSIFQ